MILMTQFQTKTVLTANLVYYVYPLSKVDFFFDNIYDAEIDSDFNFDRKLVTFVVITQCL